MINLSVTNHRVETWTATSKDQHPHKLIKQATWAHVRMGGPRRQLATQAVGGAWRGWRRWERLPPYPSHLNYAELRLMELMDKIAYGLSMMKKNISDG